jgi:hypothetical protein
MKYPFQAFLLATATVGAVTITAGLGSPFFHGFIPSLVRVCSGGTVIVTMIIESSRYRTAVLLYPVAVMTTP